MSLNKSSAISYNNAIGYSQKAIGIIQMFVGAKSVGYFDNQTVEAVYRMQSPQNGYTGGADGKVGPSTLGQIIIELEHLCRMQEAGVLMSYCYRDKKDGELKNKQKLPHVYTPPKSPEPPKLKEDVETKDLPRPVKVWELRTLQIIQANLFDPRGLPPKPILVGDYKLTATDIRKMVSVSKSYVYYIVWDTTSLIGNATRKGKFFVQTTHGFMSDMMNADVAEAGRKSAGGQETMKKEVEILMAAACGAVGGIAGGAGIAASATAQLTAATMNLLLANSDEIFKAADGIKELIKVQKTLSRHTPEFWKLCKTVLKLSALKTPEALWSNPSASIQLATDIVMTITIAVFMKRVKSLGLIADIVQRLLQGLFGALTDAATMALAGKDLVKLMKEHNTTLDAAQATIIMKEIKDNWTVVEPALKTLKAVADQLAGA